MDQPFGINSKECLSELISENSTLKFITSIPRPILEIKFYNLGSNTQADLTINVEEFISIKGFKAMGNQLTSKKIKSISVSKELDYIEEEELSLDEMEIDDMEEVNDNQNQIELDF